MLPDLPQSEERVYPIALGGGLDTETPVRSREPGGIFGSENYEPRAEGGYQRAGGCEAFDGSLAPSDTPFVVLRAGSTFGAASVGNTVVGTPSGATGIVAYATSELLGLVSVTGAFVNGDALTISGSPIGVAVTDSSELATTLNDIQAAVEDWRRALIGAVPGTGPVRGLGMLYGVLYAWRDHDVSVQKVWKSTGSGWVEVQMLHRIAFTAGTTEYAEGSTLTRSGVNATVRRVLTQSGAWAGGTAAGWIIISGATGTFTAGAATGGGACTLAGAQQQITLSAGGRWVLRPYNFFGGADMRLYGADGVNDLIEFDGEVLAPIPVSMPVKPSTVELHKQHLWAAFATSVQRSGIQNPYAWTVLTGSAELAMGDEVTELVSVAGSETEAALLVLGKDKSAVIYGDSADYRIATLSTEVGAARYTAQVIGRVIALDAAGMRDFTPTQAFGNFKLGTITAHLRRQTTGLSARASVVSYATGRYRLFLEDGRYLCGSPGKKRWAWAFCRLPFVVNVAAQGEIAGIPRVFIGCDDGYVREMDKGRSHDGEAVSYWIKLPFSDLGSAGRRKRITGLSLDMTTQSAGALSYYVETDHGSADVLGAIAGSTVTPPPATFWDISAWDTGVWDGTAGQSLRLRTRVAGETASLTLYGESAAELPHDLHAARAHHRILRGLR